MLADAFEPRALDTGGPAWERWLAILAARNRSPPRIDLAGSPAAGRSGPRPDRVTSCSTRLRSRRLAGVRRGLTAPRDPVRRRRSTWPGGWRRVLGLLVVPDRRAALLRETLAPRLRGFGGPPLTIPDERRDWVEERAAGCADRLRRAGYPVLGALGRPAAGVPGPRGASTSTTPTCWPWRSASCSADGGLGETLPEARSGAPPEDGRRRVTRPRVRKVILHVGSPEDRHVIPAGRAVPQPPDPRQARLLYPADRFDGHFLAALDLMRLPWGGLETQAVGAWDRLAAKVRSCPGTAIVSHEILATASRAQVGRALESLGADDGVEVHVVLSVRDLVRQIPAEWQENVKHRSPLTYRALPRTHPRPRAQAAASARGSGACRRSPTSSTGGAATCRRERVHVVTVPPPGSPRDLLWERFSTALGLDGDRPRPHRRARQPVARRTRDRAAAPDQPGGQLGARPGRLPAAGARAARPPDPVAPARARRGCGCRRASTPGCTSSSCPGSRRSRSGGTTSSATSPTSSVPSPSRPEAHRPRHARPSVRWRAPPSTRSGRCCSRTPGSRGEEARLADELQQVREELDRAYLRPTFIARRKLVRRLEHSGVGRGLMRLYRAARGRNSRSA